MRVRNFLPGKKQRGRVAFLYEPGDCALRFLQSLHRDLAQYAQNVEIRKFLMKVPTSGGAVQEERGKIRAVSLLEFSYQPVQDRFHCALPSLYLSQSAISPI